jgi:hypothetical protein
MSSQDFEHDASKFFNELLANTPRRAYDSYPVYSTSTSINPTYNWSKYEEEKQSVDAQIEIEEFIRKNKLDISEIYKMKFEEPYHQIFEEMHKKIKVTKKYLGEKLKDIEEAEENKEFQFDPEDLDI